MPTINFLQSHNILLASAWDWHWHWGPWSVQLTFILDSPLSAQLIIYILWAYKFFSGHCSFSSANVEGNTIDGSWIIVIKCDLVICIVIALAQVVQPLSLNLKNAPQKSKCITQIQKYLTTHWTKLKVYCLYWCWNLNEILVPGIWNFFGWEGLCTKFGKLIEW